MTFRIIASLLVIFVIGAIVYLTELSSNDEPSAAHPASGLSSDDKAMKNLKIE